MQRRTTSTLTPPRRRTGKKLTTKERIALGGVGILSLAAVLELFSRSGIVHERFLPPFSEVMVQAVMLWSDPEFLIDILATLSAFVLGLAITIAIAVPLGTILGLVPTAYSATQSILELVRALPTIALIPLVVLLAGIGLETKLVLVVLGMLWPILFNTIYGVRDVDVQAKEMAKLFGYSPIGVVRKVTIPAATPFIAAGIRIASSIGLLVVISVELIVGGSTGLGAFIAESAAAGRVVLVFAGVLISGALGLVVNLIIGAAERKWFFWQQTNRGTA